MAILQPGWWRFGRRGSGRDATGAPTTLQPGSTFAGLRIERLLGRGALGSVFLAADLADGAARALKIVALAGLDAAARQAAQQAFLAEATAVRQLQHPHIVRLHAAGQAEGVAYLVMDALPGCDLERYTHAARLLPEPLVLYVGAALADALAHAHARGIVHRDLKPANVMLHLPTRGVWLTDFGLARLADAEGTRSGLVLGTPAFMAPELLAGEAAGPASDLYALAVLLYQLLSARRPYEATSMGHLLQAMAHESPRPLRSLRPDLPPRLLALVEAGLSRQPAARGEARTWAGALVELAAQWPAAGSGAGPVR